MRWKGRVIVVFMSFAILQQTIHHYLHRLAKYWILLNAEINLVDFGVGLCLD